MNNNYLAHYGILGMRWGSKKGGGGSKSTPKKTKPKSQSSEDHKRKVLLSAKKIHEMSNTELKDLTNRLQLERNMRQLRPNKVQKGLNFVKNVTAAGTTVASLYALSTTPLAKDIAKAIRGL